MGKGTLQTGPQPETLIGDKATLSTEQEDELFEELIRDMNKSASEMISPYLLWVQLRCETKLSDMAPGMSGNKHWDRLIKLEEMPLKLAHTNLIQPAFSKTAVIREFARLQAIENALKEVEGATLTPIEMKMSERFHPVWEKLMQSLDHLDAQWRNGCRHQLSNADLYKSKTFFVVGETSRTAENQERNPLQNTKAPELVQIQQAVIDTIESCLGNYKTATDERIATAEANLSNTIQGSVQTEIANTVRTSIKSMIDEAAIALQIAELSKIQVSKTQEQIESDAETAKRLQEEERERERLQKEIEEKDHEFAQKCNEEEQAAIQEPTPAQPSTTPAQPSHAMKTRNKKKRKAVAEVIKRAEQSSQRVIVPVGLNVQPVADEEEDEEEEDIEELNWRKKRTLEMSTAIPSSRPIVAQPPHQPKPVDFEEIRENGSAPAKRVLSRISESGLEYFLGGPFVLNKEAVEEFFKTASLSGRTITATVGGQQFDITEESVAEILHLPTDGRNISTDLDREIFEAACQKKKASDFTDGRKKRSANKKPAPVKGRPGSKKDKQSIEFADPPSKTQNEDDSASSSERTASHNTEENLSGKEKGPIEEEQSVSLEHEDTGADSPGEEDVHDNNDREVAENIVRRIMEEIDLQAHEASEVYFRDSEPPITEKKVMTIINEFANTVVRPWKKKIKKAAVQAIKLTETTRDDLGKANERITSVETIALEETTSKLVDDFESVNRRIAEMERVISLEERNNKLEADLKAVTEQVTELIKNKLAADKAIEEANAEAAKKLQDALDEENRKKKETPRSDANFNERLRLLTAKNPELARSIAAQEAKEAKRFNAEKQMYDEYAKAHKKTKVVPSSLAPTTRKRKVPLRKAQVTELLGRITETVVDPPLNPALQTEDDFEKDLEPQPTRQRVFDAVLVRTVGQPFPPHPDTTGAGGSSSRSAQPAKGQPTDELMEDFLPSKLNK
ncbi:uncharacterized protein LOC124939148 [Impatiens glandulifera]|uniref:uncharacterized protein LOC124939148 n=1 Tax=Impatiens glandulifera TaxID=253017 RepID=UPI001FB143A4|nr:uncharacterized protein LOC124939148 [Impatiens glandulifera]